jgi:hypothetical protein
MTRRGRSALLWSARIGLAAGFVLVGLHAHRALILDGLPLSADEAGHALPAARMALALGHGDLGGFATASLRELVWPFVHPWVVASFFLLFGISAHVARASSLLTFGAALCLVPPFARAISRPAPENSGPAPPMLGWPSAAILVATAPWGLVCAVMGEPLGMLLTLLTLWAAARAAGERGVAVHVLCGLLAAAAFLTKYGYGVPLIAALLLALAWRIPELGWRPLLAALAGALAPAVAWGCAVFAREPHRFDEFLGILLNKDEGLHGLEDALFYGKALSNFVGWPLGIAVLLLLLWTMLRRAEPARLPSVLFVGSALLLLTLHPNKQQRYLWPALPVMLVLAETEAAQRLRRWRGVLVLWPAAAILAFVAANPLSQVTQAAASAGELRGSRTIVDFVADTVPPLQPGLFLGTTGLLPHYALTWELLERDGREPEVDLLTFPGDTGWDPRFRQGYPAEMRPEYAQVLRRALATRRYRSVVTLALGEKSPFRPPWLAKWDAWGQNYVSAMGDQAGESGYVLRAERSFPGDEAVVRVYVPGAGR